MSIRISTVFAMGIGLLGCEQRSATTAPAPADSEVGHQPASVQSSLADRDPALARRLVREQGALLLDVRTQAEFDEGHIDGAILIPHDDIASRLSEIENAQGGDRSKPIVVYCGSGRRAGLAKKTLIEAGFGQVSNLGGIADWCEDC